jgi:hypothetical protein
VGKKEPLYTVGGNVSLYNQYGKLKIDLPCDPAIPLLFGIYPKDVKHVTTKATTYLCLL